MSALDELRLALEPFGPADQISYDEETDYWQVYGDNGTICNTGGEQAEALFRLLRAAYVVAGQAAVNDS